MRLLRLLARGRVGWTGLARAGRLRGAFKPNSTRVMLEPLGNLHPLLPPLAGLVVLALAALAADLIVKRLLLRLLRSVVQRAKRAWDDALERSNVFGRLAKVVPALVIIAGIDLVPGLSASLATLIRNVATGYMALMLALTVSAFLSAIYLIFEHHPVARERPLKGVIQVLQIVVYVLGAVMAIAALLDRSPLLLLSGLGAMTAILMLVFKDSILGLVASVQLSANDMVRVGDWIEMPHVGADGDVIDVSLHTVKVQNWDKTITTIPSYKLISESFKNWRGMSESGGRRIKRAVYIDQSSVRFLEDKEVERFKRFTLLKDYIAAKEEELQGYHAKLGDICREEVNRRRLTNVGTFRAYVFNYLKSHPHIHSGMTMLVRQLSPGPEGLPIEIYCFTNTTAWARYEDIQGDIFDHVIAIIPEFGLRLFQNPTGHDLSTMAATQLTTARTRATAAAGR